MKNLINQIKTSKGNVNFYVADTLSDLDTSDKFCKAYVIADKAYYQSNSSGEWSKITTSSGGSGSGGSITVDSAMSTTSTNPVQNKVITEFVNTMGTRINKTDSTYHERYLADTLVGAENSGISLSPNSSNSQLELSYEPAKAYKESLINYPANFINSWKIETRAYSIFTVFNPLCLFKTSTSKVIFHNSTEQTLKGHCLVKIFKYDQTTLNFTEVAKSEEMDMTTQTSGKDISINFLSTSEDLNPYDTYYLCLTSDNHNAFYGYEASYIPSATTTAAPFNFKAQNVNYSTMKTTTSFTLTSEWCSPSSESIWFMLKQNS